jgi:hypothetical protein
MMDALFDLCVYILEVSSAKLGMTYKALNVYLFVFIHPLITVVLFVLWIKAKIRLRSYERTSLVA